MVRSGLPDGLLDDYLSIPEIAVYLGLEEGNAGKYVRSWIRSPTLTVRVVYAPPAELHPASNRPYSGVLMVHIGDLPAAAAYSGFEVPHEYQVDWVAAQARNGDGP